MLSKCQMIQSWISLLLQFLHKPRLTFCLVINLESLRCMWNLQGTPQVNYTFYSRFVSRTICAEYLSENGTRIGCTLPYITQQRFDSFYTKLWDGNKADPPLDRVPEVKHDLKGKVKLNPPTNLTVMNGSDLNLWFYWNQTITYCVESEVRIRKNNNSWEVSPIYSGPQSYCQNLPSSTARYELQVRIRFNNFCGQSEFWSDWSDPVVWGFNNTTGKAAGYMVYTEFMQKEIVLTGCEFFPFSQYQILKMRIKIILIPPLPKPALNSPDVEVSSIWSLIPAILQFSIFLYLNHVLHWSKPEGEKCIFATSQNASLSELCWYDGGLF
uniref:Cytokine receptor-like factor 2-like D1 domain-containing protein n=1 Tax=Xiphophorus couchianus TaxID=32473 RepID=A0A3B5LDM0_9TELE